MLTLGRLSDMKPDGIDCNLQPQYGKYWDMYKFAKGERSKQNMSLIFSIPMIIVAAGVLYRSYERIGGKATAVLCISIPFYIGCIKFLIDFMIRVLEHPADGAAGILMEFSYRIQCGGWIWFAGMAVCYVLFHIFARI